jgi:hypothetical protein
VFLVLLPILSIRNEFIWRLIMLIYLYFWNQIKNSSAGIEWVVKVYLLQSLWFPGAQIDAPNTWLVKAIHRFSEPTPLGGGCSKSLLRP